MPARSADDVRIEIRNLWHNLDFHTAVIEGVE